MKGNKKILVVAVLLLLITVSFATYAIYRETQVVNTSVNTANWSVQLDGNDFSTTAIALNLGDLNCGTSNPGQNSKIAPGAVCYYEFDVDADGSEVDVVVDAELDTTNSTNVPTNMTVSIADENGDEGAVEIPYSATEGEMEATVRLLIEWPGALTDSDTKDSQDILDANKAVTIAVKLIARQALNS